MADLKTTYKDDVLDTSVNEKRKYNMIQNADGTVSFDDVSKYSQNGSNWGANDANSTNARVNELYSKIDEKSQIEILKGIAVYNSEITIPFPNGFTKDNTSILSVMHSSADGTWYYTRNTSMLSFVVMKSDGIHVTLQDGDFTNQPFKITVTK